MGYQYPKRKLAHGQSSLGHRVRPIIMAPKIWSSSDYTLQRRENTQSYSKKSWEILNVSVNGRPAGEIDALIAEDYKDLKADIEHFGVDNFEETIKRSIILGAKANGMLADDILKEGTPNAKILKDGPKTNIRLSDFKLDATGMDHPRSWMIRSANDRADPRVRFYLPKRN